MGQKWGSWDIWTLCKEEASVHWFAQSGRGALGSSSYAIAAWCAECSHCSTSARPIWIRLSVADNDRTGRSCPLPVPPPLPSSPPPVPSLFLSVQRSVKCHGNRKPSRLHLRLNTRDQCPQTNFRPPFLICARWECIGGHALVSIHTSARVWPAVTWITMMQQQCNATKQNLCLCPAHTKKKKKHLGEKQGDVSQQEACAHTDNGHHTKENPTKPLSLPVHLFLIFSCFCSCRQSFPVMIHRLALCAGNVSSGEGCSLLSFSF